ncbi:hypothetical protein [Treponema sp.]|uniref:hypothetical protein n=1 Tax=Treponema sp. TaxID=166 RepID=UPI003F02417D
MISLFVFLAGDCFCGTWILAAKKFDFDNEKALASVEEDLACIMPQLIMEKISEGISRNTTPQEMLDRSLNVLLVERQSLFLQLSKEIKARDSIFISEKSSRKIKKQISAQEKKINEIKTGIDENLKNTQQLYREFENSQAEQEEKTESDFSPLPFNPFKNLFVKKKSPLLLPSEDENVEFYQGNVYAFFSPSQKALDSGIESWKFESEAVAANINGLIDGRITVYGEYFSISCVLYNFPGRKILGQITEVGSLKDYIAVAENTANYFIPVIANSFPVEIFFDIRPEEAAENAVVSVDGNVYKGNPGKVSVPAGKHSVKIESKGYISRSIVYDFSGAKKFSVYGSMKPALEISGNIKFQKNTENLLLYSGSDFIGGISAENPFMEFSFDGTPLIGQAKSEQDDDSLYFFYVPENLQKDQARLSVKGKPVNHSEYIDKRRIAAYRAYTLLVLSMPFTLYSVGKNNAATDAYNRGSLTDYDEVKKWRQYGMISSGITFACLGFFGFELVRYLVAANSVLPSNAKTDSAENIYIEPLENSVFQDGSK